MPSSRSSPPPVETPLPTGPASSPTVPTSVRWLLRFLTFAPLAFIAWQAAGLLQNIPMWDEFETVLTFLLDYRAADSIASALSEFVAMANEHCVLTSRLVFVLLYHATGEANFVHLAIVGNLFLIAAIWIGGRGMQDRAWQGIWVAVATLLAFQLQHHENLFSSYASIDHFQVVLLTTGCLVLVVRGGGRSLVAAGVLAALAVFTLAHGVAVLVAAALVLLAQRRRRELIGWGIASVAIVVGFAWLLSTSKLAMATSWNLPGLKKLLLYWLTMLGGVPSGGSLRWAPVWGAGLLGLLLWAAWRRSFAREAFLSALALTAVLGCALIAYGRSSSVEIPPVSSRYMVQSAFAWAAAGMILVRLLGTPQRAWTGAWVLVAGAVAVNLAGNLRFFPEAWEFTQRRIDAARQYDERETVAGMKRPIFPQGATADRILATAAREDLYHLPVPKSREVVMPEGLQLYPIIFHLDKVALGRSSLHVRGWMLTLEQLSTDLRPHLQLVQGDRSYLFRGFVELRPDVAQAKPDRIDAEGSGFYFAVPFQALPPGSYSLRVVLIGQRRTLYNETKRTIEIPPRP